MNFALGIGVGVILATIAWVIVARLEYERGAEDAIENLRKRRGGPPHPLADDRQEIDLWRK